MELSIREAYDMIREHNGGSEWVRLATVQELTGSTPAELKTEVLALLDSEPGFRADPEVFTHRLTDADRRYAVRAGGEDRHKIAWYGAE